MAVRVLLVEDSIPARNVLKRRLEQIGCAVLGEANDPVEGLDLFRRLRPDLITLDLIMPRTGEMDAKALFRVIRKESPQAAVIVISSRPKAFEAAEFLREGAIGYFEKPFISAEHLLKTLGRCFPELLKNGPPNKDSTRRL